MSTLDINTNGAWRVVISDLRSSHEAAVLAACVAITQASVLESSRRSGVSWRLRDAEGTVYGRLEHDAVSGTTAWRFK